MTCDELHYFNNKKRMKHTEKQAHTHRTTTHTHACTRAHTHTHMRACTHIHMHAHTHTYIQRIALNFPYICILNNQTGNV